MTDLPLVAMIAMMTIMCGGMILGGSIASYEGHVMEWLGLALLPLVMCGAMCVGGAIVAFLGIRSARRPTCHTPEPTDHADTVEDYSLERR